MAGNLKEYLIQFDDVDVIWEEYQDYLLALHVSEPNRDALSFDVWEKMEIEADKVLNEINEMDEDIPKYKYKIIEWLEIRAKIGV